MAFVSDGETSELVDPGEGALDHPAVLSQMLTAVDAAAGDSGRDGALAQILPATVEVVAFVGMELFRRLAGPSVPLANRGGSELQRGSRPPGYEAGQEGLR